MKKAQPVSPPPFTVPGEIESVADLSSEEIYHFTVSDEEASDLAQAAKAFVAQYTSHEESLPDSVMFQIARRVAKYCEIQANTTFHWYQRQLAERLVASVLIQDAEEITALFSRQSGKTETLAVVVTGLMVILPKLAELFTDPRLTKFKNGFWVGLFGPTYFQVSILYRRMRQKLHSPEAYAVLKDPEIGLTDSDLMRKTVSIPKFGSFVDLNSAAPGTKIEGQTFHLIVMDESQDVDAMKVRKCLAADSMIYHRHGRTILREARDVTLCQVTLDGEERTAPPHEFLDSGVQPVRRVSTSNGRYLDASLAHRWLCRTRTRKHPFVKTTEELQIGDAVAVPERWAVDRQGTGTYSQGVVLGALLGDGCMSEGAQFCGFPEFVSHVALHANAAFGCSWTTYHVQPSGLLEGKFVRTDTFRNALITWLTQIGVHKKTGKDKFIPEMCFTESEEFVKGLIVGLIETDGCVVQGRKPHISFANISRNLVESLADLLWQFGIHVSLHSRENSKGYGVTNQTLYELRIKGQQDVETFRRTISLVTKQAALDAIPIRNSVRRGKGAFIPSSLRFTQVQQLQDQGSAQTYCYKVAGQTFFANGLLSLNSIHPMLAATAGTIVKLGTPNLKSSDFMDACLRNKRRDLASTKTRDEVHGHFYKNHFEFDYRIAAECNPRYALYVQREMERLGYDSDEFRMAYRIQWIQEKIRFFTIEQLENVCVSRGQTLQWVVEKSVRSTFKVSGQTLAGTVDKRERAQTIFSIDFGRSGSSTIVTVADVWWDRPYYYGKDTRYRTHVLNWLEMYGDDHEAQHPKILEFLAPFQLTGGVVDATGKGDPIYSRLKLEMETMWKIDLVPFIFSTQSKHMGYTIFHQEVIEGRFTVPFAKQTMTRKHTRWFSQMYGLEKEYRGQWLDVHKPKGDPSSRDDYPDSSMMLCWYANVGVTYAEQQLNTSLTRRRLAPTQRGPEKWIGASNAPKVKRRLR